MHSFRKSVFAASCIMLAGCERAPSVDVLGSFFPIWMVCILAAILLTLGARFLLIRIGLDQQLGPPIVVYTGMVVLFACAIWLLVFRY